MTVREFSVYADSVSRQLDLRRQIWLMAGMQEWLVSQRIGPGIKWTVTLQGPDNAERLWREGRIVHAEVPLAGPWEEDRVRFDGVRRGLALLVGTDPGLIGWSDEFDRLVSAGKSSGNYLARKGYSVGWQMDDTSTYLQVRTREAVHVVDRVPAGMPQMAFMIDRVTVDPAHSVLHLDYETIGSGGRSAVSKQVSLVGVA